MKTEYRILPYRTLICDNYLQFRDVAYRRPFWTPWKKIQVVVWRFIPTESYASALGYCLYKNWCPTKTTWMEHQFLCAFHGNDWWYKEFIKKYPNIEDYFVHLRERRSQYLNEQRAAANAEIIYLKNTPGLDN